ncbi:TetR/AcrR family transcriptional regulator [Rhodomicrobium sp. Az07]|uniref:TetR/AcrR family transcriptional regulator n=1 Tax=Rhodomicrobium sp. Az07 TaxID=2839034 RepID=UPI001BEBB015|nr:TetR/AcrR family transcriptional regulator [Rhodomicrobium sp. Az07]MBT3071710.1 TetR/AcrR family transcriptional regulator [Rhodomicrobium sp. Az07]
MTQDERPEDTASHSETDTATPDRKRPSADERRAAILAAAFEVFAEHGFAAARLEDVARKAGVAKGTLYLYFPDKEALFEQLLLSFAEPVLARIDALAALPDLPAPMIFNHILTMFQTQFIGTEREKMLHLLISEGPRFPRIAEFHHREVVSKGLAAIRDVATRGFERGELHSDALVKCPQLFFWPMLGIVIWRSLFGRFDPIDVATAVDAHRDLLGLVKKEKPE